MSMQKKFKLKDMLSIDIHQQPQDLILEGIQQSGNAPYDRIISLVFSTDEMTQYLQNCIKDGN